MNGRWGSRPDNGGVGLSVDLAARYGLQLYGVRFILDHTRWTRISTGMALEWKWQKFDGAAASGVPTTAGVYAFCVEMSVTGTLAARYVMYVGKAESSRGLRRRYREYVEEASGRKAARPRMERLFVTWPDHLMFGFAETGALAPEAVEGELLQALMPPMNDELPAAVRAARKAFE